MLYYQDFIFWEGFKTFCKERKRAQERKGGGGGWLVVTFIYDSVIVFIPS